MSRYCPTTCTWRASATPWSRASPADPDFLGAAQPPGGEIGKSRNNYLTDLHLPWSSVQAQVGRQTTKGAAMRSFMTLTSTQAWHHVPAASRISGHSDA